MVRIPGFHCRGPGSIPDWGTEIPQAAQRFITGKKTDKGCQCPLVCQYDQSDTGNKIF